MAQRNLDLKFVITISILFGLTSFSIVLAQESAESIYDSTQDQLDATTGESENSETEDSAEQACESEARRNNEPQLSEYCSAAELAAESAKAASFLWKVHGAIAATCGYACMKNFGCKNAHADFVVAKEAANAACLGICIYPCLGVDMSTVACRGGVARADIAKATTISACTEAARARTACTGASIGGTVADITQSNNLNNAGLSLMGALSSWESAETSAIVAGFSEVSESQAEIAASSNPHMHEMSGQQIARREQALNMGDQSATDSIMACAPFVTETTNTLIQREQEQSSLESSQQNYALAAALVPATPTTSIEAGAVGEGLAFQLNSSSPNRGSSSGANSAEASSANHCQSAMQSGGIIASVQCASQVDPGSSAHKVLDPRFQKDFENQTGIPLDQFLTNASTPSSAIGGALAKGLGLGGASEAKTAIEEFAAAAGLSSGVQRKLAVYSGSNSGAKGSKEKQTFNVKDAVAAISDKLMPNTPDMETRRNENEIAFKMNRSKTDIEEDRDLSLFDRVSYRYKSSRARLARLAWKSPYNAAIDPIYTPNKKGPNSPLQVRAKATKKNRFN